MENTMAQQITYRDKPGGNTVYADIDKAKKLYMLDRITLAYYELIERTNYDDRALQVFHQRDRSFRKHLASNNRKLDNTLGSFLAGLIKQHHNKPDKDISTKMLEGVDLATLVLNKLELGCEHYEFVKESSKRIHNDTFGRLFQ